MKKNLTELVFIIDKSGSMGHLVADTIGGFNSMIEKYKAELDEVYVTTVLFDDVHRTLHNHVNINEIELMTRKDYYASGCTALLDAVGRTINSVGQRLFNTPEEERPEKVIFVITTDGEENSSREFTRAKVKEMIEHQQTKYSWGFLFLGANIDAESEAESIGISRNFAAKYAASSRGVDSVYDALSSAVTCMACCDSISASASNVKATLDAKVYDDNTNSGISSKADALDAAISYVGTIPSKTNSVIGKVDYSGFSVGKRPPSYDDYANDLETINWHLAAFEPMGLSSIDAKAYSEITDMEVNNLFGVGTEN